MWKLNKQAESPGASSARALPVRPASGAYNPVWQEAAEAAVERASRSNIPDGTAVKIPDGFKNLAEISQNVLPASKRPPSSLGSKWYHNEKRQLFWNGADLKLYVIDPVTRLPAEFQEPMLFDLKISVGACFHMDAVQSRHVVVKDLMKAAPSLGLSFDHLDKPCSVYALYEGHRGAQENRCAEYCAAHLHQKLLSKLAAFRGVWDDGRLKGTMVDIFQELDAEFAAQHPSAVDGCCAMVVLVMGRRLVLASLGDVACVICNRNGETFVPFKGHAVRDPDEDDDDDDEDDADDGPEPIIPWTRAFGDLTFKQPDSSPRLSATPDVAVAYLDSQYRGVALVCRALYKAIGRQTAVSTVFKRSCGRPRMASGAMVDAAVQWLGKGKLDIGLGSIVAFFDNMEEHREAASQKRRKVVQPSQVRVRHILLKHSECKSTTDKVRNKQVTRTRSEAERILRAVLEECEVDPKNSVAAFTQRCKDLSEYPSSSGAEDLVGDLGWVKPGKNEQTFGASFDEAVFSLQIGQLSDLIDSDHGIHIFLRTA